MQQEEAPTAEAGADRLDTDNVEDTATAASNALPPARIMSSPASVASAWPLAIAVPGGVGAIAAASVSRAAPVVAQPGNVDTNNPVRNTVRRTMPMARSSGGSGTLLQPQQLGQQLVV